MADNSACDVSNLGSELDIIKFYSPVKQETYTETDTVTNITCSDIVAVDEKYSNVVNYLDEFSNTEAAATWIVFT